MSDFNLSELKKKILSEINFREQDICKPAFFSDKYDIVYMSNILQRTDDYNSLKICKDNLAKILNKNGIIVCTNFLTEKENYEAVVEEELEIFKDCFELKSFYDYNPTREAEMPIYYTYTKK